MVHISPSNPKSLIPISSSLPLPSRHTPYLTLSLSLSLSLSLPLPLSCTCLQGGLASGGGRHAGEGRRAEVAGEQRSACARPRAGDGRRAAPGVRAAAGWEWPASGARRARDCGLGIAGETTRGRRPAATTRVGRRRTWGSTTRSARPCHRASTARPSALRVVSWAVAAARHD